MNEEWRPVLLGRFSSCSRYDVSSLGRVRNRESGKVLRPFNCPTRRGHYMKVDLRFAGMRFERFVHIVVARAFIPNPQWKPEVGHEDNDPMNNRADNLAWVTRQENENHKRFWTFGDAEDLELA